MSKIKFEQFAINCTKKSLPTPQDYSTYIGLEHMDTKCLQITRWGSDVPLIGEKLVMHKGDILLGKRNAYLRRAAIAPHDGLFSAHGMILRPKEDVVNYDFFALFIASDYFFDEAIRISVGSLSPTINWKDLKDVEFDLPDLETQRKLAKVLWAINDTITTYRDLLQQSDELAKSHFIEMFGDVFRGESNYPTIKIADVVVSKIQRASKSFSAEDEIRYVDISSIDNSKNVIVGYTNYLKKDAPSRAQQHVRQGDILISTVRPNLNNVARIFDDFSNIVASSGFCVLRAEKVKAEFLFGLVSMKAFAEYLDSLTTGANYPAVSDKDILNFEIPNAPEEKQLLYAEFINQIDRSKISVQDGVIKLETLYKKLINQYLKKED